MVPVTAVAVVAGVGALGPVVADASPDLPGITAQDLLAKVQTAKVDGLSGTVTSSTDLGLPAIPGLGADAAKFTDLLTGKHTARVAFAAPDKARVSVIDQMAERTVTTDGKTAWVYDSSRREATKLALPAHPAKPEVAPEKQAYDPQAVAKQFLAAIDPSTKVVVSGTQKVAGRDAYKLRLIPKTDKTTVGSVTLAIDSKTWIPLEVTVMPRTGKDPAVQLGFSAVSFAVPDSSTFSFTPPKGVKVTEQKLPTARHTEPKGLPKPNATKPGAKPGMVKPGMGLADRDKPTVVGKAWESVLVLRGAKLPADAGPLGQLLAKARTVQGTWGSGKILTTKMVSALITDDGRVFVGLVTPDTLEAAAAKAPR
ncbi:outer membrane lipoprotein-sorting protein [Kribbella voronezhensis]|uniref:Outer membrane lipoprotein-sorting protein n=1 Tax=Kribbella voronezhensis TaxID=2512212 RepID=A0A4R7T6I5_9ACTN|nr:outer membrane lipoprotein-sorting protein [Kribbella voronezhensis]